MLSLQSIFTKCTNLLKKHLAQCLEINSLLIDNKIDENLEIFFVNLYSLVNFLFVWRFMKKFINIDASFDLRKYFCKS